MIKRYIHIYWYETLEKNNQKAGNNGVDELFVETGMKINLYRLDDKSFVKEVNDDLIIINISGKGDHTIKLNESIKIEYKDGYQVAGDWIDESLIYEIKYSDKTLNNSENLPLFEIENSVLKKVNLIENKIIIPEGVEEIGNYAFYKSFIKEVVLPSTLKKINKGAFMNCNSLVKIIIPEGAETIDTFAFAFSGIEEVEIPNTVKEIGSYAFAGTKFIDKHKNEEFVILGDGLLYMYNGQNSEVIVPEGAKTICSLAFFTTSSYNDLISKIVLPNSVEIIYDGAFANLKSLKEININSNMKIHKEAFKGSLYEDKFKEFLKKNGE